MKSAVLILPIALLVVACGGKSSSPVQASSVTQTSSPPAVPGWQVTQRFVSVEGPDNCWVREQRQRLTGAVFPNLPMTVTRSTDTITPDRSRTRASMVNR